VAACPRGAREIVGRRATVAEIIAQVERDVIFYEESGGGVTFSGGEPLVQPAFLGELLRACRARDIHTALDTTCCASWEVIDSIRDAVGLWLCDLKHLDPAEHERSTGVSNREILDNLRRLARSGEEIVIRFPIIPGVNDSVDDIRAIREFLRGAGGASSYELLPYHGFGERKYERLGKRYRLTHLQPPSAEGMRELRSAAAF
jgi:pyruvate formate lyase activating enzyme